MTMPTQQLFAYWGDDPDSLIPAGTFSRNPDNRITFRYRHNGETHPRPVSLSLMPGQQHHPDAALNYLDNLLPDNLAVRERWAKKYGIDNDPLTLLSKYGQDVAGALVFSTVPFGAQGLSTQLSPRAVPLSREQIAERIAVLNQNDAVPFGSSRKRSSTWDELTLHRWTLAGAQGKFALHLKNGQWYEPDWAHPSTHILKPPHRKLMGIEVFEAQMLGLADAVSRTVTPASIRGYSFYVSGGKVMDFGSQATFITSRWDRWEAFGKSLRSHAEDMAQVLGLPSQAKYSITAAQIINRLQHHAPAQIMAFIRQLAFNTYAGNADAHAKNYSIQHNTHDRRVELAPLYDAVPTFMFPRYNQTLAMSISSSRERSSRPINPGTEKQHLSDVTPHHWAQLAEATHIDPDETVAVAMAVREAVIGLLPEFIVAQKSHQVRLIAKHMRVLGRTGK